MNRIKGYRNMIGMSQKDMSKILGIAESTYRQKEKGKSVFKENEIKKFIDAVKSVDPSVNVKDIFFN